MRNLNRHSQTLVAAIAIMLLVAVLSVSMASMLGVTSRATLDHWRSSQAFALAQAGLNWYMEQLTNTANWTSATNQLGVSLSSGTFDVILSNKASPQTDSTTATRMDISVTGKMSGTDSVIIPRTMSQRVWKLPSASKFALFWGRRTGSTLTLSSTTINGDFWSQGSSTFSGSTINGFAFQPSTEVITGATSTAIAFPYFSNPAQVPAFSATFSVPALTATYYTNLITAYDALIAGGGAGTVNQNTNLVLAGTTLRCQTFNTNTIAAGASVTISGNGIIIATRDINLNTSGTNGRTLTITPSGGNIIFLAARSVNVNTAAAGTHPVTGSAGIRMYSQGAGATNRILDVENANTSIIGAFLLANRSIVVRNGAHLNASTLFVNDAGSTTNNLLQVTNAGTTVGTLAAPCTLISLGRESASPSALTIDNGASVTGLAYQFDDNNLGSTRINTATVIGSIIASQFQGNSIASSTITYNSAALPDPPVEGFNNFSTKEPDSWNGN